MTRLARVDGIWIRPDDDSADWSVLAELRANACRLDGLQLHGKTVVDLGANIGVVSVACARVGAARVLAVEPNADNLKVLHANAAEWDAIEVYECAVGATVGTVEVVGEATTSHVRSGGLVPLRTLVSLLDDAGVEGDIALVKIDIEGGEWDVVRTLPLALQDRVHTFVIESHGPEVCPWVDYDHRWDIINCLSGTHDVDVVPTLPGLAMLYATRLP